MTGDNIFKTGRNAVIATLVVIALNPVSLFIGYYLSKELAKPQIRIEYIRAIAEGSNFQISPELLGKLKVAPHILAEINQKHLLEEAFGGSDSRAMLNNMLKLINNSTKFGLEGGEVPRPLLEALLRFHDDTLTKYNVQLESIYLNKSILSENKTVFPSMIRDIPEIEMEEFIVILGDSKKKAIDILEYYNSKIKNDKKIYDQLYAEAYAFSRERWDERTGEIEYEIGLLNYGDTDGVIYPVGKLVFNDFQLKIKNSNDKYVVLSPHTFESVYFTVDKKESISSSVEKMKQMVKKSIPEKHTLRLNTSMETLTQDVSLPVN